MLLIACLLVTVAIGDARPLSREEVEDLWERLLREEQYEVVEFLSPRSPAPTSRHRTDDKSLKVMDGRAGYLWGLFGLSDGGGWSIRGQVETETAIPDAILQLYSRETIRWRPGIAPFWMPGYDRQKYPAWEFRLVARHPTRRQNIRVLRSVALSPADILPTEKPDGTSVKELLGQRIPRGELRYDARRGVAIVQIFGLRHPTTEEISIPSPLFSDSLNSSRDLMALQPHVRPGGA